MQYLPLKTGFIAELTLIGVVSFDLSGQIQLSLWNRNEHSLVEKNAGLTLQGSIKVDSSFVKSQVEFNIATEAKLNLMSDIDFYTNVAICLQLRSPDSIVKSVFQVLLIRLIIVNHNYFTVCQNCLCLTNYFVWFLY